MLPHTSYLFIKSLSWVSHHQFGLYCYFVYFDYDVDSGANNTSIMITDLIV